MTLLQQLRDDECGVAVSVEIILLMMILVFGIIAGNVSLRDAVNQEAADTGLAINNINQSYSYAGNTIVGVGTVSGSEFADLSDENDGVDTAGEEPAGLSIVAPVPATEG
jgi:hypothetical protein